MKYFLIVLVSGFIFIACRDENKLRLNQENKPAYSNIEKDTLVHNFISAINLINDIDDTLSVISNEIRTPKVRESAKIPSMQDNIRHKLQLVTERLRQYKGEIKNLVSENKNYSSFISTIQKTISIREKQIGELQVMVSDLKRKLSQKEIELSRTLKTLQGQIDEKQKIKYNLTNQINTLSDENDHLKYTAYYVYGTEEELEEKGLLRYSGGIFLFGLGKTPVPSSFEDNALFKKLDKRNTLELTFPSEIKNIISPQNQKYCRIEGNRLIITENHKFWESSPYLLVITKK